MGVDGVRLYFDLGLGKLVDSPGFSSSLSKVAHKRGDGGRIEVLFSRAGVAAAIGTPTEMVYAVKEDFEEATDPLILANTGDWTLTDGVWSAAITGDGAAILVALNGATSGVFKGEFTFTDENGGPTSSQTLAATIYNDVWKGTEGTPLLQPTPDAYVAARALLFDRVQSLTDPQKVQVHTNIGFPAATAKTTPVDADTVPLTDSADSNVLKKLTFANLKTWVQGVVNAMTTITGAKTFSGVFTTTQYKESVVAIGTKTTTHTLTLAAGTVQSVTLTAATACTFTMPAVVAGASFILEVTQAAGGTGTAIFTGVIWPDGETPVMSPDVSKVDLFSFVANAAGTAWRGSATQNYPS